MQVLDSYSHLSRDLGQPSSPEHQVFDSLLKIAQSLDPHEILSLSVQLLQNDLGVDRVVAYEQQASGQGVITTESAKPQWQNTVGMTIAHLRDLQVLSGETKDFKTQAIQNVFEAPLLETYRELLTQQQVRSSLVIPLVVDNQDWGAIVAHSCAYYRGWEPIEIEHCQRIASHVAIALQRALQIQKQDQIICALKRSEQALQDKTYQLTSLASQQQCSNLRVNAQLQNKILELEESNESLERQTSTTKILADFILKIRQSLELETILDTTVSEIQRCLRVDRLAICRINEQNIGTIVAESVDTPWLSILDMVFSAELLSVQCQQNLNAVPYKAVPNVEAAYANRVPQMLTMLKTWGVKAKVVVPIVQGEKLWGFIIAHQCNSIRYWTPAELDLLTQVTAHVSISIEQAGLYKKRLQALEVMTKTEQMLVVQNEQISHILASSPGILYSSLSEGHYQRIFFGTNLLTLLGYTSLDSIETDFWLNCIHPEDRASVQLLSDKPMSSQEYRFCHKDGTYRWLYDQQKVVYDNNGKPLEWIGYCVDISERKQIENQLKLSLAEKEILLQEIHHRVKNNLNIIISLLKLQSNYIDDDAIIEMLADSQSRIYTMALIHEQLYGSENLGQLNFSDYVNNLVEHLRATCNSSTDADIEICVSVPSITLNLETATPCGLILNELITNAFKYAFRDSRSGTISISLIQNEGQLQLIVQDDGVGFAPDIDWQNSPTLGLRLVRILSRQLDATLDQTSGPTGTRFCLVLSELDYKNRI